MSNSIYTGRIRTKIKFAHKFSVDTFSIWNLIASSSIISEKKIEGGFTEGRIDAT
jgi:hypothetical protein